MLNIKRVILSDKSQGTKYECFKQQLINGLNRHINMQVNKELVQDEILFIGSPVYAHHLQYHVKDLIKNLPQPVNRWGKIAVPFITYGAINSGIALDEAGKLLRKSGRKVLAGMKVCSSHHKSYENKLV